MKLGTGRADVTEKREQEDLGTCRALGRAWSLTEGSWAGGGIGGLLLLAVGISTCSQASRSLDFLTFNRSENRLSGGLKEVIHEMCPQGQFLIISDPQ